MLAQGLHGLLNKRRNVIVYVYVWKTVGAKGKGKKEKMGRHMWSVKFKASAPEKE